MINPFDEEYHRILRDILANGERMENRTGTDTLSVFGRQMRFDLRKGFPLITTKKIHLKSIIHELLWMLSGGSRIDYLREHNVKIWDEWADVNYRPEMGYEDGDLGPVYGVQWRAWPQFHYHDLASKAEGAEMHLAMQGVDQIAEIVDRLKNKPQDRRIILSAWNVADIPKMKLPPCHCFAQFSVRKTGLACHMYIRSWDVFLGGPFNIAQYALLTMMLAQVTDLAPGELIISSGDTHLYLNHLEQARMQLEREPRSPPVMDIDSVAGIDDFRYDHFTLSGYDPHPAIKAEISV